VRRSIPLLIAMAATLALVPAAARLSMATGNDAWIDRAGPAFVALQAVDARFGRDDGFVIGVFAEDVLALAVRGWQAGLEDRLRVLPGVAGVRSLLSAQDVQVDAFGPGAVPLIPARAAGTELEARERERLLHHPLYANLLADPNGRGAAILVTLRADCDEAAADRLNRDLNGLLAQLPPPAGTAAVIGGLPAQKQAINAVVLADQRVTVPLSLFIHCCLMLLIVRRRVLVLIPVLSIVSSMVWTYALIALAGKPLDAVLGLLPPLVMGVAVASALHLIYAFASARLLGQPQPLASALRATRAPLLLATAATTAGVLGLHWGPVPAVRGFAPFAAASIVLAALAPVLWLWALSPWIDDGTCRQLREGSFGEPLGRRLGLIAGWSVRRRWWVLGLVAVTVAASAVSLTRLSSDADFLHALPPADPVRQAHDRLDHGVTGVLGLDLLIDPRRPLQIQDLDRLAQVEAGMRADPSMVVVVSLADLMGYIGARTAAAGQRFDAAAALSDLPIGAPAAWKELVGAPLAGGPAPPAPATAAAAAPSTTLRIIARQRDASMAGNAAGARAAEVAARAAFPGATVIAASGGQLLDETSQRMIPAVVRCLLLPLPVLAVLLVVVLRSLRLAALALPVAGLPLLVTYAALPVVGWPVDIGVSMIACIALGVVLDDAARMLVALGHERDATSAITRHGPVLVGTSLAMAGSFLACLAGAFAYTRHFGILLAAAFIIALVVNLCATPALFALCSQRAADNGKDQA
jgi:predicted RND superfamily exporter protein